MYQESLDSWLAWADRHEELSPLAPMAVEMYFKEMRLRWAGATVYSRYRVLSTFIGWLVRRRYILPAESPLQEVDKPKMPRKRMKFVTKEQFDRLYTSICGDDWAAWRDRLLITILFYSGLRAGELLNLRVADIERDEGLIFVRQGKGRLDRQVPYIPLLNQILDRYLQLRAEVNSTYCLSDALFVSQDGYGGIRGEIGYEGLRMIMLRLCKNAGMKQPSIHSFRHGFAMIMLNNGMDMSALSAAMGHSSVTITLDIYARWVTAGLKMEFNTTYMRIQGNDAIKPQ